MTTAVATRTMRDVRPSQLRTLLLSLLPLKRPILIEGDPGIGKTSIVRQVAEMLKAYLVISTPAIDDPTDGKGLPWPAKDGLSARFIPIGKVAEVIAYALAHPDQLVIWFLDDLGQATEAVQKSYMPWLLGGECAGNVLPPNVVIVAATNGRTARAGVSGLLEPVKSRFLTIIRLVADLAEWAEWYVAQPDLSPMPVAFCRFDPESFHAFEPTADLVNSPQPRTWEHAGRILNAGVPDAEVEVAAISGAIGEGTTTKLMAFIRMFNELPTIESILQDPEGAAIPRQLSVLYAVVTALAAKVTPKTFPSLARFAERLMEAERGDQAVLMVMDAVRRTPTLQSTSTFVKLTTGPLGELFHPALAAQAQNRK